MKKTLLLMLGVLMAAALYLGLWPVAVDPVAWTPSEPVAATGVFAPNTAFEAAERLDLPEGAEGPEDVAVDSLGRIYGGLADGRIVRLAPDGTGLETLADTGGRPLGLAFDSAGTLLIADAFAGLLALAPDGALETLATGADGRPFRFTDDVDVGPDGTVYFSDASDRFSQAEYTLDVIESRPHGRLLAYDPATRQTRTLLDSLYFANGVAVSRDGAFVLVNETTRYRVLRYWLRGPRAGTSEAFVEGLPGFPDGIAAAEGGRFWLTLIAPRSPLVDALAPHPALRKVVMRLPAFVRPRAQRHGYLLALDADGRVLATLQSPTGTPIALVSSVEPHGGMLYLGSLEEPAIGRLPVPDL